jgi:signal transduction histidine kinase/ligand-binding sensor domain-containing protein/DNA-binding response OmpR family regulator
MIRRLLITFIINALIVISSPAQQNSLWDSTFHFNHIGANEGLTAEFITHMLKDTRGYLWLCSNAGLIRYDGKDFKQYSFSFKDSTTLSNSRVSHVMEDKEGFLWVSTDQGINRYDYRADQFFRFKHDPNNILTLPSNEIKRSFQDSQGRIWVGSINGLSLLNPVNNTFKNWLFKNKTESGLVIEDIIQDKEDSDILWIASNLGIIQFHISDQSFTQITIPSDLTRNIDLIVNPAAYIIRIIEDDHGALWLANTYAKLFSFNKKMKSWKMFSLTNNDRGGTLSLFQFDSTHIWASGIYSGIKIINTQTGTLTSIDHDPDNPTSPPEQVFHVFRDNEGIIWCSTNYQISKIDPYVNYFKSHKLNLEGEVYTSCETKDYILLALNPRGIIYKLDKQSGELSPLRIEKRFFGKEDRLITSSMIYSKEHDELWLATTAGVLMVDLHKEKTFSFEEYFKIQFERAVSRASCVMEDAEGNLVFSYATDGLFKFSRKDNKLFDLTPILKTGRNAWRNLKIYDIGKDKNGNILLATQSGLQIIDQNHSLIAPAAYIKNGASLQTLKILCIKEDAQHNIWLGTHGNGLFEINYKQQTPSLGRSFSAFDGMADNIIEDIAFDSAHNLWATSHNGLIYIDLNTHTIKNYNQADGLKENNLGGTSLLSSNNGMMYLLGEGKIVSFNPENFPQKKTIPPVYITQINVSRKDSVISFNPHSIVPSFNYSENDISFTFSVLNFSRPKENKYEFQLIGLNDFWTKASEENNTATFTNLHPGDYTFWVRGANQDGTWNKEGAKFHFTILPPLWRTWWAYVGYVLLVTSITIFTWRRIVTRAHLKTLALVKSAEATKLIELDALKSRFFSNISHEFRTPLTLILGPLEKRLEAAKDQADRTELSVMHRNASRLLVLINQLLDFSRLEAGTLKLKCRHAALQPVIQNVSSQFSSMATSKKIHFEIVEREKVVLFFDQDKIEKIISNLLANSFKFTPAPGNITLTLDQHPLSKNFKNGYAEIIVRDTGIGIPAEHLSKIFERFYQVDMSNTRGYEGSGIGLSLTKELVELHHGTIEVSSELNVGTVFTVRLPLGKEHLSDDEIIVISEGQIEQVESPLNPSEISIEPEPDEKLLEDTILIIEDNGDLRSYIRAELRKDFKLIEAENGEEGLKIAIREIPTLVVTDLMMPKKDGLSVCHELKEDERTSHIPVILLTAKADIDSKLRGLQTGADDYMAKPFGMAELRIRIQNLIAIRKKLHTKFARNTTVLPSELSTDSSEGRFLKKLVGVVETHISETTFGVESLAIEMAVSKTQLYRKFQAITGSGPNEFIRHIRLHRAADLLRNKSGNVSEVAYQVGFNNLSYFAKCFKEKFGAAPNEFLKNPPPIN